MTAISDMDPSEVASWIASAGAVLVEKDPAMAAKTFTDLNVTADAALGEKIVRYRLGVAHSKRAAVEALTNEIARMHFVTVDAIMGSRKMPHIAQARRHLAHALRNRLHLSLSDIARVMRSNRSTAMRQIRAWNAHIGGGS